MKVEAKCPNCGTLIFHEATEEESRFGMAEFICPAEDCGAEFDLALSQKKETVN